MTASGRGRVRGRDDSVFSVALPGFLIMGFTPHGFLEMSRRS